MTEKELIANAKAGDQMAYTELYRQLLPRMGRISFKYLRGIDQEDGAHDLTTQVITKLHKFKGESKLSTWATRVGINYALMKYRSSKSEKQMPKGGFAYIDEPADEEHGKIDPQDHHHQYEQVDARLDLEKMLKRMAPGYRDTVLARFIDESSVLEVAEEKGLTVGNIKSQQHKGMKKARYVMDNLENISIKDEEFTLPDNNEPAPLAAPIVPGPREWNGRPLYGDAKGSTREPVMKVCACNCKERFYTYTYAQRYIEGHKPAAPSAYVKKADRKADGAAQAASENTTQALAVQTDTVVTGDEEMVTIRIPARQLDRIIALMPTSMKTEAVQNLLAAL